MKLFMSYYSGEASDAEDIADYLKETFRHEGLEVFMASSWASITPGDPWQDELLSALREADALLVLMSIDALSRSWLNFEIGVAWALKVRILIFCHRGLTPRGLPRPYSSLQAIDVNDLKHVEVLEKVAQAVATALDLRLPEAVPAGASSLSEAVASGDALAPVKPSSFASMYRTWSLRPAAHLGETAEGEFLIGTVNPSRPDRARAAELIPGETLYVRLFIGSTPEGRFVPALVTGETAEFFERVERDTVRISVQLRLAAAFIPEEQLGEHTPIPIVVIDSYRVLDET